MAAEVLDVLESQRLGKPTAAERLSCWWLTATHGFSQPQRPTSPLPNEVTMFGLVGAAPTFAVFHSLYAVVA